MKRSTFISTSSARWLRQRTKQVLPVLILFGLYACAQTGQTDSGSKRRIRIVVGEIKEISLPSGGDSSSELIGASDNQEVVDVSRPQLAAAVDTLKRSSRSAVFQIKGITMGTANVIFSAKPMNQAGNGQTVRTYVVQVMDK